MKNIFRNNRRMVDGVALADDEHFSVMDDILGDAEKVKSVLLRLEELAMRAVLDVDCENKRDAIIRLDQIVEGVALIKKLFGLGT